MREDWKIILKSLPSFTYRSENLDYSETNSWTKILVICFLGFSWKLPLLKVVRKIAMEIWYVTYQASAISSDYICCQQQKDNESMWGARRIPLCFKCHWRCQLCSDYGIFLLVLLMKWWKLKQGLSPMFLLEFAVLAVRSIIFWSP